MHVLSEPRLRLLVLFEVDEPAEEPSAARIDLVVRAPEVELQLVQRLHLLIAIPAREVCNHPSREPVARAQDS